MGAGIFRFFPSSPSSFSSSLFSFVEASATIKSWFHFARHAPPEIIRFFSTSCNSTETLYFRDVDGNARIFFLVACKRVHLSLSLSLFFLLRVETWIVWMRHDFLFYSRTGDINSSGDGGEV